MWWMTAGTTIRKAFGALMINSRRNYIPPPRWQRNLLLTLAYGSARVEVIRLTRRDSLSIFKRPVRVSETPSRMISAWRLLFISRELKSSFLILCSGLISITGSWMVSPCDPAQKEARPHDRRRARYVFYDRAVGKLDGYLRRYARSARGAGEEPLDQFHLLCQPEPVVFAMGQFHLDAEQWRPFLPNPIEGRLQRGFRRRPDDDLSRRPIF